MSGREARDLSVRVNDENVSFSVDDANAKLTHYPSDYERCKNPSGRMKIIIKWWHSTNGIPQSWEDTKTEAVERSVTEIVVELRVAAERQFREHAQHHYEWMVEPEGSAH